MLKTLRIKLGLNQETLAERANVSLKVVQRAEQGKNIEESNAAAIAKTLGEPVERLFNADLRSAVAAPDPAATTTNYDVAFAELVTRFKDPKISAYPGFGWGTALSLQDAPDCQGWPILDVQLQYRSSEPFRLQREKQKEYARYFKTFREQKRFNEDNTKFMLEQNPTAFSDAPSLVLRVKECKWSEIQFYRDNVANSAERNGLLEEMIEGSLCVRFPHSLCMHMVVMTADNKLLITRRSPKVSYYPGAWSCSVEENLAASDLRVRRDIRMLTWGLRQLHEELGLDEQAIKPAKMRLLSVFVESDCLNVSICAEATLNITAAQLDVILQGHRRTDWEFTQWAYLEMDRGVVMKELTHPSRNYHPTSGYRVVQAFLKHFGIPSREEIVKVYPAA